MLNVKGFIMDNTKIIKKTEFPSLISYEKERTERNNSPFSLIHIDLSNLNGRRNVQFTQNILNTMTMSIRTTDRLGWMGEHILCILLPDTNLEGAKAAATKYKNRLTEKYGNDITPLNLIVSTYPDHSECTNSEIPSTPSTAQQSIPTGTQNYSMDFSSSMQATSDIITTDASWILDFNVINLWNDWQITVKRMIDILGAVIGIVLFTPMMLLIAASIKLTSKGPVFFIQERMGYQGKKFPFLKFRSMHVNNDDRVHREYVEKLIKGENSDINMGTDKNPYYKMKEDPRITPLGKVLRKSSMDELPQFFNVLLGHMSLVGPRPPIPYELSNYQNWHMKRILDVKPGITGLWQVKGRSLCTFDEMVRLDLQYAKNWDLWLDLKILTATFKAVFCSRGAD